MKLEEDEDFQIVTLVDGNDTGYILTLTLLWLVI